VKHIQLAVLGCVLGVGCTAAAPEVSTTTAAATGPAVITTDAVSYHYGTAVVVTWSGLGGNQADWIALAPMGAPVTTTTRWAYVAGAATGSMTLEGPVPGGTYVARAFDNDSYTLMGESDAFAVADSSDTHATLTLDRADYAIDTPITVTWTGMPADVLDWVSISPPGRADHVAAVWLYTGGAPSGSLTFDEGMSFASQQGFPGGDYVARLYLNDTYTRVAETAPVLIGSRVTTDAATYVATAPISVSWVHLPGGPDDWVGLAPAGAKFDVVTTWLYTGGARDGSQLFASGLTTPGTYVARTYAPNTYYISGESAAFTVTASAAATLTTDKTSYALGEPVTVSWTGLSTNANDWIAIAPDGSSDTTVTRWIYTAGAASGSFAFEGPATAATYVARAFFNDTYTKVGESAAFPIN
jgi:acid phosphatase type 7